MSFKDDHVDLQHLVRELELLREHNLQFKEGDPQDKLLLFAEGAVVLLTLERFMRAILDDATEKDTLPNLLERAISRGLVALPWNDQKEGVARLRNVRNTILHGNFEQAAAQAGCSSVADYFKKQFAGEVETLYRITGQLFRQIDPDTGRRRSGGDDLQRP